MIMDKSKVMMRGIDRAEAIEINNADGWGKRAREL